MFEMFEAMSQNESIQESSSSPQQDNGKRFVISAGGSVFFGQKPDAALIAKFGSCIEELHNEGFRFAIVAGGGSIARTYCAAATSLGMSNFLTDNAAIHITRANAALMLGSLKDGCREVLSSPEKAEAVISSGKIPVYGGLMPSLTTDAVAALLAEFLDATFVNLTDVGGIYSSDPSKHPGAKLYEKLTHAKLMAVLKIAASKPGQNFVLDTPSCLILRRSKLRAAVLKGSDLENFRAFVRGQPFTGTLIEDEQQGSPSEADEDTEEIKAEHIDF
jgi:uridylate kinase